MKAEELLKAIFKGNRSIKIHCPFHNERTPSMIIDTRKEDEIRFHCFGCGMDGWLSIRDNSNIIFEEEKNGI